MISGVFKKSVVATLFVAGSTSAMAGGYDTQGLGSFDILFAKEKYVFELGATVVNRNVEVKNTKAKRLGFTPPTTVAAIDVSDGSTTSPLTPNVWRYGFAAKFRVVDNLDCMAKVHNPWEISEQFSENWIGRYQIDSTDATSLAIDGMCAYKFQLSENDNIRIFGGARAMDLSYYSTTYAHGSIITASLAKQGVSLPTSVLDPRKDYKAILDFNSNSVGVGWRVGAAYELPEYALRAVVSYDSKTTVDLEGNRTIEGLGMIPARPGTASVTLPQSVEVALQSGVAPGWLVGLGAKWMDWSTLDELRVDFADKSFRTRVLGYSDGWTVRGFVKHQLTDKLGVGTSLTWDKGIGGSYSDTYNLGVGFSYDVNDNVKFSLGTAAIYKSASEDEEIRILDSNVPTGLAATYDYDSSWNFAVSSKIRLAF
ncbi:OmpP1/FadL family transporter [Polycladidibacter stylochi]|uniref:OmpP1/FadL family transporter n=1 Tax=Polycladidibacter stylochi TaxID=1807766 RepID=UPI00082E1D1E|nr:outer membrane protein transport protein [Pseudovibrio stylochi]